MDWWSAGKQRISRVWSESELNTNDELSLTQSHRDIIRKKAFLRATYIKFYDEIRREICRDGEDSKARCLVELGSGGGFLKEVMPGVITSDVLKIPFVDVVFSATEMPFKDETVDGFMMLNVFHHLNDVAAFLGEISRCLKKGGKMIMIEPSSTLLARFVWKYLHHEPYDPAGGWGFKRGGPLLTANGALPYIVFFRDRQRFQAEFPSLRLISTQNHTPMMYILSGGMSLRQLIPTFAMSFAMRADDALRPLYDLLGMFITIKIEKI